MVTNLERCPGGARGRRIQRRLFASDPPAGRRAGRQTPRGDRKAWVRGRSRTCSEACRRHSFKQALPATPRVCDPQSSAASCAPGPLYAGKGRCPYASVSAEEGAPLPSGHLPLEGDRSGLSPPRRCGSRLPGSPGQHRLPHSPSVATVPASKSRQSLRPRASSRTLLSPRPPAAGSSRSALLRAIGARPGAAPRAPATSREFHLRPRRGPGAGSSLPVPRPPTGSASAAPARAAPGR